MLLAGIGHLTFQRTEFLAQVPRWLPSHPHFMDFIVLLSGVAEISLGLAMIFWTRKKAKVGIALAIFFVLIFPGNISPSPASFTEFAHPIRTSGSREIPPKWFRKESAIGCLLQTVEFSGPLPVSASLSAH